MDHTAEALAALKPHADYCGLELCPWPAGRFCKFDFGTPVPGIAAGLGKLRLEWTPQQAASVVRRLAAAGFFKTAAPGREFWRERGLLVCEADKTYYDPNWEGHAETWIKAIRPAMGGQMGEVLDQFLHEIDVWKHRRPARSRTAVNSIDGIRLRNRRYPCLWLTLVYAGPQQELTTHDGSLTLRPKAGDVDFRGRPFPWPHKSITEAQSVRIIDWLDAEGFFDRARETDRWGLGPEKLPHFQLQVVAHRHGAVILADDLGWNPKTLGQLKALREALQEGGERSAALDAMDRLITRVEPLLKGK